MRPNSFRSSYALDELTNRDARHIQQCVTKDRRRSASSLAQEVFSVSGKTLSAQTVHRINNGLHGRVPRKKPLLNAKHRSSRLSFAKTYRDKERNFWSKILWSESDETKINLFGSDGIRRVYSDEQEKPITKVASSLYCEVRWRKCHDLGLYE